MLKRTGFFGVLLTCTSMLYGQKLAITRIDVVKEKLVVYYTLDDSNPNHNYKVSLYSSKDNFALALTKVTGDVGPEVKPGEKKIEWNVIQELGDYSGTLSVEVRAGVFIPFVKLTSFDASKKYKRGKTYPLLWTSGNMGGQVDIELFSGQSRVDGDRNVPNTGKYEFAISGAVKPGSNYHLRFTNTRNRDEFITSPTFSIIPKYPTGLKAGGILLFGGAIYLLLNAIDPPDPPLPRTEIEPWPQETPDN